MKTTAVIQRGKRKLWDHNPAGAGTFLSMGRVDIELNHLDQHNFQLNQDSSKETSKMDLVMPQTVPFTVLVNSIMLNLLFLRAQMPNN